MGKLTNKRVILAKIESSYATDPTPDGTSNAILVRNLNFDPQMTELAKRDLIRPYLGNSDELPADVHVQVDFEVELAGSGTAGTAPGYGPLLKACGMSETTVALTSVTYAPVSSSFDSVTIYMFVDGIRHKMTGCRGTVEISMNVKQIPTLKFTFKGKYNAPTDTANPTCVYTSFQQPEIVNTTNTTSFSLLSYSAYLANLNFNLSNDIQYRNLVGYQSIDIIDRKPAGTAVIEAPALSSKDYFAIAEAGTTGTASIVHGTAAGNIVTLSLAKVNIQNPTYSDMQGVQMLNIPFVATPSSGNDEFSLAFT